jgi:molecular chaperone DnaK (HSP70)
MLRKMPRSVTALGIAWLMSYGAATVFPAAATLTRPIGILTTVGFSEMIPAGATLPKTYSDSFGNAKDNQTAIEITIAQKDATGTEKIVVAVIDKLPPRPKGKLNVIVTITVDINKQLRLKATVPDSGYIKELGPFPVT